jgi:hypothetical protein
MLSNICHDVHTGWQKEAGLVLWTEPLQLLLVCHQSCSIICHWHYLGDSHMCSGQTEGYIGLVYYCMQR